MMLRTALPQLKDGLAFADAHRWFIACVLHRLHLQQRYGTDYKVATSGGSGNLTVGYTYDRDGNLLTQTDASGTLTYTYDGLGREATRAVADGAAYTQGYDPAGNLKTLTDPNGTTTYGYDAANHLTSLKDPTGASTTFTYDEDGNRTATKLPGGTTQSAQWDNADRPTQIKATTSTGTLVTYNYSY
ncbi:hypothetical protein GT030_08945, partial [Streptomyces sp. SID1328]|nr:hypothetical protein [Streptomyces sp. SID1328]